MLPGRKKKTTPLAAGTEPLRNEPTDDQRRGLFLSELVKLERIVAEKDTAVAAIRAQRKSMKIDGFSRVQVDYALELRRKAPDISVEQMAHRATVARWLAHPVGHQFSLFGEDEDRTPAVDVAREEGKTDGLAGAPCKPRHDPSTELYRAYIEGYQAGQDVVTRGFKTLDDSSEAPSAAEDRPGKRRGMPSAPISPKLEPADHYQFDPAIDVKLPPDESAAAAK